LQASICIEERNVTICARNNSHCENYFKITIADSQVL